MRKDRNTHLRFVSNWTEHPFAAWWRHEWQSSSAYFDIQNRKIRWKYQFLYKGQCDWWILRRGVHRTDIWPDEWANIKASLQMTNKFTSWWWWPGHMTSLGIKKKKSNVYPDSSMCHLCSFVRCTAMLWICAPLLCSGQVVEWQDISGFFTWIYSNQMYTLLRCSRPTGSSNVLMYLCQIFTPFIYD